MGKVSSEVEQYQFLKSADDDWHEVDPYENLDILLIRAEKDLISSDKAFKGTFGFLTPQKGQAWHYHTVSGANTSQILFDQQYVDEVADQIDRYVSGQDRLKFSLYQFIQ